MKSNPGNAKGLGLFPKAAQQLLSRVYGRPQRFPHSLGLPGKTKYHLICKAIIQRMVIARHLYGSRLNRQIGDNRSYGSRSAAYNSKGFSQGRSQSPDAAFSGSGCIAEGEMACIIYIHVSKLPGQLLQSKFYRPSGIRDVFALYKTECRSLRRLCCLWRLQGYEFCIRRL